MAEGVRKPTAGVLGQFFVAKQSDLCSSICFPCVKCGGCAGDSASDYDYTLGHGVSRFPLSDNRFPNKLILVSEQGLV